MHSNAHGSWWPHARTHALSALPLVIYVVVASFLEEKRTEISMVIKGKDTGQFTIQLQDTHAHKSTGRTCILVCAPKIVFYLNLESFINFILFWSFFVVAELAKFNFISFLNFICIVERSETHFVIINKDTVQASFLTVTIKFRSSCELSHQTLQH